MFTIYQIINTLNGKSYVGFTIQDPPKRRLNAHRKAARRGSECYVHRAMMKDGFENFTFEILEVGENEEYGLKTAEPSYILWLKPEYNMTLGGEGMLGWKPTEEQRIRNSETKRGIPKSLEHCAALSEAKRVPCSKIRAEALSRALKGVPKSIETRRKMSEARRRLL